MKVYTVEEVDPKSEFENEADYTVLKIFAKSEDAKNFMYQLIFANHSCSGRLRVQEWNVE